MQCIPFYSVVLALDKPKIDFLSLDIEGSELQVLQTIPFDKGKLKIIKRISSGFEPFYCVGHYFVVLRNNSLITFPLPSQVHF